MIETAVATPDGRAGAQLLLPSGTGPWAGVLFYMDGLGIRPGLVGMAHRLAEEGYAVLLPDLYYRSATTPHSILPRRSRIPRNAADSTRCSGPLTVTR